MRRLVERRGDEAIAALAAALFAVQIATSQAFAGHRGPALAAALVFSATLAVRTRLPLVPLAAGTGLIEVSNLTATALANSGVFFAAFVLTIYSAGRHTGERGFVAAAALLLVAFPLAAVEPGQPFSASDATFIAVAFAGPLAAGRIIRRRHEQAGVRAREAVEQERVRIARELHDVVAHAISVMVLQARGGRRKLPAGAPETREALDAIERAGEQALTEMRRLLEMLRDDDDLELAPQPSLSRLDDLVAGLRAGGLPVELVVEGEPCRLPPGIDVTAFRIVQEALTNALKHAGPARAQVVLRYSPAELELEIVDDGRGATVLPAGGHGLVGIRERVAVYGGELQSGGRPEGGFALRARLPLPAR
jgi:signal transduction histidine kinase